MWRVKVSECKKGERLNILKQGIREQALHRASIMASSNTRKSYISIFFRPTSVEQNLRQQEAGQLLTRGSFGSSVGCGTRITGLSPLRSYFSRMSICGGPSCVHSSTSMTVPVGNVMSKGCASRGVMARTRDFFKLSVFQDT